MALVSVVGDTRGAVGTAENSRRTFPLRPVVLAGAVVCTALLGRRFARWGATDDERTSALPGDELLPLPGTTATRAITIHAWADDVWPWIAQLGQGRGGFYSYDLLENVVARCDIHSADRIVEQWQDISVGDQVRLAPEVPLTVAVLEPGRALVLRGAVPLGETPAPYDFSWAFVLHTLPDGTTRLLVRERYRYLRPWGRLIVGPAGLVSSLMSPKMLRGIKSRVEHTRST